MRPRSRIPFRFSVRSSGAVLPALRIGACLVAVELVVAEPRGEILFRETFDEAAASVLRKRLGKHDNAAIESGRGPDGSDALRVVYRGGPRGSLGISESVPLSGSARTASLSYDLRFEASFDFSRGGKLPGLGPARPVTGGRPIRPAGWSARPMWREKGLLTAYLYHQDQPGRYGDYTRSEGVLLDRGRYLAITIVVTMNTAGDEADGSVEIFVDGERRLVRRELRLGGWGEHAATAGIERLVFTTFHGGSDESWAPRDGEGNFRDVIAWFDNVEVVAGRVIRESAHSEDEAR